MRWNRSHGRGLWAGMLALALAAGCSTVKSATGMDETPKVDAARLVGLPDREMKDVTAQMAVVKAATEAREKARRDARVVDERSDAASSRLDLAKAEKKEAEQQGKVATRELPGGAEQRAAQEEPAADTRKSALYHAELKVDSAKAQLEYLETLHKYAVARVEVGEKLVLREQAKLELTEYQTLERARPEEAKSIKQRSADFTSAQTKSMSHLSDARADMEKHRAEAVGRYDHWSATNARLRASDRGEPVPAPDAFPPI